MTTAIVHGDPGSRKTATLVGHYGIPALYEGRVVISNIRGFNDLKKIEKEYGKKLPESAQLISLPFTRDGFRKMGNFFHWAPVGALILMDEGQRVYPTRLRNLNYYDCNPPRQTGFIDEATGVAEDIETVEEAFDCHRHMNWDIYISTPNIEKVHKEIRQVAEFGYRQKDMASISKILAYIWHFKRVKHNAENKGIGESQAIVSGYHRVSSKVFRCYQSTATGTSKGTHTKTSVLSQPKLVICLCLFAYGLYSFGSTYFTYGSFFPSNKRIAEVNAQNDLVESGIHSDQAADQVYSQSDTIKGNYVPVHNESNRITDKKLAVSVLKTINSYSASVKTNDQTVYWLDIKTETGTTTVSSDDLEKVGISFSIFHNFVVASVDGYSRLIPVVYSPPPVEVEPVLTNINPISGNIN